MSRRGPAKPDKQRQRRTPEPEPLDPAVLAEHPLYAAMPQCGVCGTAVRWMTPAELREVDPEAYRGVTGGVHPDVVARADVWWCPGCGGVGIRTYEGEEDPGVEERGAVDADDRCTACGVEVEWYDPAYVATIDKDAYLAAKRRYGVAALLEGDVTVCPGCGRITFFPTAGTMG